MKKPTAYTAEYSLYKNYWLDYYIVNRTSCDHYALSHRMS